MLKLFTLESRSESKIWKAPKHKKWMNKILICLLVYLFVGFLFCFVLFCWFVGWFFSLNGSDHFLAVTLIFQYWNPKVSSGRVRIGTLIKNDFFFLQIHVIINPFHLLLPNSPKVKVFFGIWSCKVVWHFSTFTHTALWNSYYSSLLISFYHKIQFQSCLCYSHLLCSVRRKWECRI